MLCAAALVAAVCAVLAAGSFDRLGQGGYTPGNTEAERVEQLVSRRFTVPDGDLVLLIDTPLTTDDISSRTAGAALTQRVAGLDGVRRAASYWTAGDPTLRSRDGRSALIIAELRGSESDRVRTAARIVPRLTTGQGALTVSATGAAWMRAEAVEQSHEDLLRAELLAAPLVMLLLISVYGTLVATLVPMTIGLLAMVGALAVLRVLSTFTEVSAFAVNITTALGFGLACDYGLFIVARYREGVAAGLPSTEAVAEATRTAGRTVVFSAAIVALAFSGLMTLPQPFLTHLAWAGIVVVTLSAVAALCVVPALLAVLGPHLDRGDVWRWLRRSSMGASAESLAWRRIGTVVARRPALFGGACCTLLVMMALPFGHARFGLVDERTLPSTASAYTTADRVHAAFTSPPDRRLTVVLTRAADDASVADYARRLSRLPGVTDVRSPAGVFRAGTLVARPSAAASAAYRGQDATLLTVTAPQVPGSAAAVHLVADIRAVPAPAPRLVGGLAVLGADTVDAMADALPLAALITLTGMFVLLLIFTRSLLLPVKAIVVGLLSLTASFGTMVLIFQEDRAGWLVGDFTSTGQLDTSIPPLLFCIAFGLSVDYELLLLSRIKEDYIAHGDNRAAVVFGVAHTGRLVTAAASVVAASVGTLVVSGVTSLKVLGFGLALAVLVDATIVRGVLVPAVMCLAGRANWWVPRRFTEKQRGRTAVRPDQVTQSPGQITRIRATVGHDLEIPPFGGVHPGVRAAVSKDGTDPGVLE
ncbi:efflux RND transporter permease subunit [Streptomyces sp. NBC_00637]|uniref:MMPL family transporter n=1 Tax=Streptomyces sp. NBC_00637 TaxID=2903667 RepID=UPI00324F6124